MDSKSGAVRVGEREVMDSVNRPHQRVAYQDIELKDLKKEDDDSDELFVDAMGSVPLDVRDMQRMGKEQVRLSL